MIFTDWIFPLFLAGAFACHWLARGQETRLRVLLVASMVFYGWWDWRFLALIGLVIVFTWVIGFRAGDPTVDDVDRSPWMWVGVIGNLAVLAVFKYFNFFADSFAGLAESLGAPRAGWPVVNIILPVGVSFYIFQAISYIADLQRGRLAPEYRLSRVALYISFFPQLVAGPIVRAASFFPQMDRPKALSQPLLASGLKAFVLGWTYKAGLADNIAPLVDPVFGDVDAYSNLTLVAATFGFGAQIYFDFAGYSLMAIGVARWFGYYIPTNFAFPYASTSIDDFWRRWHISLSSWLRDYLYIPLGGNRRGEARTYLNLMITMLLGGLWHGASWTFVAWGAMQGAALALHRAVVGRGGVLIGGAAGAAMGLVLTQLFVVLAWAPFRADSFGDAMEIWRAFVGMREGGALEAPVWLWFAPVAAALDAFLGRSGIGSRLSRSSLWRSPAVYWGGLGVLVALLLALYPLRPAPFVYFQF